MSWRIPLRRSCRAVRCKDAHSPLELPTTRRAQRARASKTVRSRPLLAAELQGTGIARELRRARSPNQFRANSPAQIPASVHFARPNHPRINSSMNFSMFRNSLIMNNLKSTRINTSKNKELKSRRINTSGHKDLKSFRINTSKKQGRGVGVTSQSAHTARSARSLDTRHCPARLAAPGGIC
jgi:hypothetical protein